MEAGGNPSQGTGQPVAEGTQLGTSMSQNESHDHRIDRAARAIRSAEAILIGAGAGMGVDSGLPDFRGAQGFWRAYPPYAKLGLAFESLANPRWFDSDPELAWGFYGHRMMLYRQTTPHGGFAILHRWTSRMPRGGFVYTSNVDGHFQQAGFSLDHVYEVHGTTGAMQCQSRCGVGIFSAEGHSVDVDPETMRARAPLPSCPRCGQMARPNILMFGDWGWDSSNADAQQRRLKTWLASIEGSSLVVIECGAGTAIPTVRLACEGIAHRHGGTLIRINPREPVVPSGQISLPLGALKALAAIDERLGDSAS
jgi:NAD-dependent SIR2 family protein deacetylase